MSMIGKRRSAESSISNVSVDNIDSTGLISSSPSNNSVTSSKKFSPPVNISYKSYLCPGCSQHYDTSRRGAGFVGKSPLILDCRHTICEECVKKNAFQSKNIIVCSVCQYVSQIPPINVRDTRQLQSVFPYNYYLMGLILCSKQNIEGTPISLSSTGMTLRKQKLGVDLQEPTMEMIVDECCLIICKNPATVRCEECNDIYCNQCCTVVHKSGKSLWSHKMEPIVRNYLNIDLEKCSEHTTMDIDFYCQNCEVGTCCYCFLEKHEGHERILLSKLNEAEILQFNIYKDKAKKVLRYLTATQKKIKYMNSYDTSFVETKISKYFADMHAQLFCLEKKLRGEASRSSIDNKGLTTIYSSVSNNIENIKQIVNAIESLDHKKMNLKNLLDKLVEVDTIPCHLITKDGDADPIRFSVDPALKDLESYFSIEKSEDNEYVLVSNEDLPENFKPDCSLLDDSDSEYAPSSKTFNSELSDTPVKTPDASVYKTSTHKRKHSGSNEQVFVTHINTTEEFYVQKKSMRWKFTQLSKEISQIVKHGSGVTNPKLHELYIVLYVIKNHKEWCRCQLIEIIPNQGQDTVYHVFLIDYGNTIKVGLESLKAITPNIAKRQPFAMRCRLINPANAEWSKMAHIHMAQIITEKDTYMFVKSSHRQICSVNLMISSSSGNLTSVAELLILACENTLIKDDDQGGPNVEPLSMSRLFKNNREFKVNDSINVIVTHIENPYKIYVQIAAYRQPFQEMVKEIQHQFNKIKSCIPLKGSCVIVQYKVPLYGIFHRAEVTEVNFNLKTAAVFLPDIGISTTVPWNNVRILTEQFCRLECQAIPIKLAQIEPQEDSLTWPVHLPMDFFTKYILTEEPLKMVVYKESPLEVALFEVCPTFDICLNALFVEKGLASSTGIMSQTVQWQKVEAQKLEEDAFMIEILKKQQVELDDDEDDFNDNTMKQPVDVIRAKTPDLIYIKFHMIEEKEAKLNEELQVYYTNERQSKSRWKLNEKCVVYDVKLNKFCRAIIMGPASPKYPVYLYDLGKEFYANTPNIFIYNKYFEKYHDMCFKCHLANVQPAGGTLKWSALATEYLQNIFDENKNIFVKKVQDTSHIPGSLPVEMWYSTVIPGSALEPSQTQYKSIKKLLLNSGLALRKNSKTPPTKHVQVEKPVKDTPKTENGTENTTSRNKDSTGKKIKSIKKRPQENNTDSKSSKNSENENKAMTQRTIIGNENEFLRLLKETPLEGSSSEKKQQMTGEEALTNAILKNLDSSTDDVFKNTENKEIDNTNFHKFLKDSDNNDCVKEGDKNSNKVDWNDLIKEEEQQPKSPEPPIYNVTDWLPPFKITKTEFTAIVTTADYEGILFLHDSELHPFYKDMQKKIQESFVDIDKEDHVKTDWKIGDLCMILYDENWYRGKVVNVTNKDQINVYMIDFGSDHNCKPEELLPNIVFPDIPAFASRVKLHKVYSISGSWTDNDYQILMDNVTESCEIIVKDNYFNEIPSVEVFTSDGKCLNEFVAKACVNLARTRVTQIQSDEENYDDDVYLIEETDTATVKNEEISESSDDNEILDGYKTFPLNKTKDKVLLNVVNVLKYDLVVLEMSENSNEYTNDFLRITKEIQECASKQEVLEEITEGFPCICPYSEDGVWYRAEVFNTDSLPLGYVLVYFVDYGNIDSVSYDCIRKMKPSWFKVPVYNRFAKIDVTLKDEKFSDIATNEVKKMPSKMKLVEFIKEDPLTVHLYDEDGENLCYQELVDKNIIVINKNKDV